MIIIETRNSVAEHSIPATLHEPSSTVLSPLLLLLLFGDFTHLFVGISSDKSVHINVIALRNPIHDPSHFTAQVISKK
jgi:hypothetical protein